MLSVTTRIMLLSAVGFALITPASGVQVVPHDEFVLVSDGESATGAADHDLERHAALLKNAEDLARYLEHPPTDDPLRHLNAKARDSFLSTLTFGDNGLTSFNHRSFEGLNAVNVYRILALFGAQNSIANVPGLLIETKLDRVAMQRGLAKSPTDHIGYACAWENTCMKATDFICMSGC